MKKRILIIGVGSIGERHVRCFQATNRAELAICEIDGTLRQQIVRQYDVRESHASLEAALSASHDAAVIATPAHLHVPMAMQLAEAGLHLLIEKPLSVRLDRIPSLVKIIAERNLQVAVAYVLRHHPALQAMRRAIQDERFGRPVQLVAVCGQHFPTYRPAYRQIYYTNRHTGGGAVQDALTHVLNAGQWLIGPVDRLAADMAHQVLDGVDVEDTVHVMARHGDVLASYSLNQHQAPNEFSMTVICERGTCRLELHNHRWTWMTSPDTPWQADVFPDLERDDLFVAQANAFLDLLDNQAEPTCDLGEAIHTLHVNQTILAAAEEMSWKRVEHA